MKRTLQPKKAREFLVRALSALEDPVAYCQNEGYRVEAASAHAYAAGAAKALLEFALEALGQPRAAVSMGIKGSKACVSPTASAPKGAPNPGEGDTSPGLVVSELGDCDMQHLDRR